METQGIDMLRADLSAAAVAAREAADSVQDDGTCNMDFLFVRVGDGCRIRRKGKAIEVAIAAAGCSAFYRRAGGLWPSGYLVTVPSGGQAAKRTAAVERADAVMRERGWDTSVWYQMD